MDEEFKQILKEELELHKQSLSILKKLHHDVIYRRVFNFLKWGVVIALTIFGYIQAKPYIDQWLDTISSIQGSLPKGGLQQFLKK